MMQPMLPRYAAVLVLFVAALCALYNVTQVLYTLNA